MNPGNILEIKDVSKSYKDFKLENISFNLPAGYVMGLIGENGAGKTTLLKLIMGMKHSDSGEIKIFDKVMKCNEVELKNRIGFAQDVPGFHENLSVKQTERMIARFYENWDSAQFVKLCRAFNISQDKKVRELSGGAKNKLSISIALSHSAELIILDEPTSGMDPGDRSRLLNILRDFIEDENKSVLFSTHITSDLEKIADYVVYLKEGRQMISTSMSNLKEKYRIVKGSQKLLNEVVKDMFISIKHNEYGFSALTSSHELIKKQFNGKAVYETPSLEDIMVYFNLGRNYE